MTSFNKRARAALFAIVALALGACAAPTTKEALAKPDPLGDFKLGYAIVVSKNAKKGPFSREMPKAEVGAALKSELEKVFGAYEGKSFYHIGVSVDAYILAMPGIPLVASPKSALIVTVNVWDDAKQAKILEENKQFTILEPLSSRSIFGSGYTQTKEEQLAGLTKATVKQIQRWMRENEAAFKKEDAASNS